MNGSHLDNEAERLQVLREHKILDTPAEPIFDRIVRAAQEICQTPVALVSLVDEQRQWFKARVGLEISETPRNISFCHYGIQQSELFIVPDALLDQRFANNPLVTGAPNVRFYAGVPLKTLEGHALGMLCVLDRQPRKLTMAQIQALQELGRQAGVELQRRRAIVRHSYLGENIPVDQSRFFRRLATRFGLVISMILGIQAAAYWSNTKVVDRQRWVTHTLEVISGIETVKAGVAQLQANTQKYVITAQAQSLIDYNQTVDKIETDLQTLRRLTGDNSQQQQNLNQIQPVLQQETEFLKRLLLARQQSLPAAVALLNSQEEQQIRNNLQQRLNQMRQIEESLLQQRLTAAEASYNLATLLSSLAHCIVLGLIVTSYFTIRQETRKRRQAEMETVQQRDLLEVTLSSIGDGVIAVDRNKKVMFMNPIAEALTGWPEQEAKGQAVDLVFRTVHIPTGAAIANPFEQALAQGQIQTLTEDTGLQHRNGPIIPVDDSCAPISDKDGALQGAIMVFRDITGRRQAEAEIQASLQKEKELKDLKSNFISMVSHDIRTPLAIVLSAVELLQNYGGRLSEEKKHKYFQQIRGAVKRMQSLLDEVLLINKVESGALKFDPEPLNLQEFCLQLVEEIGSTSRDSHTIVFTSPTCPEQLWLDKTLLHHILANLLSNAVKYSPQGGSIQFGLQCQPDQVIFRVQDPGIGIPPEDIPKLFTPFNRAGNVGKIAGTGLGLSIVKNCVEFHSGQIDVVSELGRGTTFTVVLPTYYQPARADSSAP